MSHPFTSYSVPPSVAIVAAFFQLPRSNKKTDTKKKLKDDRLILGDFFKYQKKQRLKWFSPRPFLLPTQEHQPEIHKKRLPHEFFVSNFIFSNEATMRGV